MGICSPEDEAIQLLKRHAILPAKCLALIERFGADLVCDTVEYLESQMNSGKRNGVENPAGLIKHLSPAVVETARETWSSVRSERLESSVARFSKVK